MFKIPVKPVNMKAFPDHGWRFGRTILAFYITIDDTDAIYETYYETYFKLEVACNKDKTESEYSWNRRVISGTYQAKGVFAGRLIYEKTVREPNNIWWSMRFDAGNNRWDFTWSSSQIAIGKFHTKLGATIENFSNVPGELTV